jgi:hypothetical protein
MAYAAIMPRRQRSITMNNFCHAFDVRPVEPE